MPAELVHLHAHSQYSMLDGSIRLEQLVAKAASLGMPAIALTDHGNMFGAVQFYKACGAAKIKPILGCEVAITGGNRADPQSKEAHHLVLLASGQDGYQSLVELVSLGWVEGMSRGVPRIDFEILAQHSKGLVGLSACMGGYLAQEILQKGPEAGREAMARLRDSFAPGHFFVELQDHGFLEQGPLNEILVELSKDLALPYLVTNDCHYLSQDDATAQLVLQCIGAGRTFDEMQRTHHKSEELYLKTGDQMLERFRGYPEALANTLVVAEMCAGTVNPLAPPKLPRFQVPDGSSEEDFLRMLSTRGLARRIEEERARGAKIDEAAYHERLRVELDVIVSMGFSGYFLIVQDFINWGKANGVPVGPGRGSGAGSIVAWSLRITDLDPIPYGLLFERFLNPERVSMPDFDVDFCMDKRDRVIEYVRERYGRQSVGQIATFHLLKSKSVVRDVARVMGMPAGDGARVASLVPEPVQGKTCSIDGALTQEPRLKALYDGDPQTKKLLDTSRSLEDLTRHAGMHAAGVVISEGPLWHHVPVFCPEPDVYVTQYHKDDVEYAGLVKFDFLGLKTLTVLDIAVALIAKRPDRNGEPFDLAALPLNDATTFTLLGSGETTNVFQLESSGMQSLFKQLKPDCFEDIVAAVALYRPGPLGSGMVEDFVQRKHGRVKVEYPHKALEHILKDTYGVIVYQEQVMQIARDMAGYSLGGADLLRRAMGKKKAEEMAKQKATFIAGATAKGFSQEDADRVFELMAYFAGYGFNKSHSAAYALITYHTAYLKAHYPVEFTCATLSADKDKTEKVVRTVAEARAMGITVLPPDVNQSAIDFTVVYSRPNLELAKRKKNQPVSFKGKVTDPLQPKIRFGLGGVKGVGENALEAIFEARAGQLPGEPKLDKPTNEPFENLFDLCARVDLRRVNKGVLEALVQCGAFDEAHVRTGVTRASAFNVIDGALERGKKIHSERISGQTNLFSLLGTDDAPASQLPPYVFPRVEPWDTREMLAREKGALGFYVSGHPLDRYALELQRVANASTESLASMSEGSPITIGGSVEGYRERPTKTGSRIAFFSLEDSLGRVEVIVRPKHLGQEGLRETLQAGDPVLLKGIVQFEQNRGNNPNAPPPDDSAASEPKIILESVQPLAEALRQKTRSVKVRLRIERLEVTHLKALRDVLMRHPGPCPVALELWSTARWTVSMNGDGIKVEPSESLLSSLERIFGEKVCELRS